MLACPIATKIKSYPFEATFKDDAKETAILADHITGLASAESQIQKQMPR
jgi:mRNA-degrading endonuclease toxin of MazEF toxin-antitoxin module